MLNFTEASKKELVAQFMLAWLLPIHHSFRARHSSSPKRHITVLCVCGFHLGEGEPSGRDTNVSCLNTSYAGKNDNMFSMERERLHIQLPQEMNSDRRREASQKTNRRDSSMPFICNSQRCLACAQPTGYWKCPWLKQNPICVSEKHAV